MSIILEAAKLARTAHAGISRDFTGRPYIEHPARVASRVMLLDIATEEMAAAAVLHDVVEDTSIKNDEIKEKFGPVVSGLVFELTNQFTKKLQPSLNRAERKAREVERLRGVSREAKIIKMLDRNDNLQEINFHDDFCVTYIPESELLLEAVKDGHEGIALELKCQINDAKWQMHRHRCGICDPACAGFTSLTKNCEVGKRIKENIIDRRELLKYFS